jgi:hypothetical protein
MQPIYQAFFTSLLLLSFFPARTQQTGLIEYKSLGISFRIPDGWVGQEANGVFLMGSNTIPGFIMLTTNEANSVEVLKQEAQAGIVEQNGTNLQMLGNSFEPVGQNGIGTEFEGTLEYQAAKAYVIGVVNPHGSGVTIISATLKDKYTSQHRQAALTVANSLQFKKADIGPLADQWKERISGTRLTYMSSYNSGGGSGGYSNESIIDLCPQGYFNYSTNNHMSIDIGSTAYSNRSGAGAGQWKVIGNHSGQAVLQLNFNSGEVYEYVLSQDGDKTFLNGDRYFRTWTGDNAPNCN